MHQERLWVDAAIMAVIDAGIAAYDLTIDTPDGTLSIDAHYETVGAHPAVLAPIVGLDR